MILAMDYNPDEDVLSGLRRLDTELTEVKQRLAQLESVKVQKAA